MLPAPLSVILCLTTQTFITFNAPILEFTMPFVPGIYSTKLPSFVNLVWRSSLETKHARNFCTEVFLVILNIISFFEVMFTSFAFIIKDPVIWQHTDYLTVIDCYSRSIFLLLNFTLDPLYVLRANKLVLVSFIAETTQ